MKEQNEFSRITHTDNVIQVTAGRQDMMAQVRLYANINAGLGRLGGYVFDAMYEEVFREPRR